MTRSSPSQLLRRTIDHDHHLLSPRLASLKSLPPVTLGTAAVAKSTAPPERVELSPFTRVVSTVTLLPERTFHVSQSSLRPKG
jgi:hypothetical protein